ncbi:helix-turn-helix transcriptional regulator [Micromonospora chalcea]|uniref:helix-turn-helix transcriptional regulator n=1 Tax=Micromonospora chalcea TaxID=1874 RepID=UPI0038F6FA1A
MGSGPAPAGAVGTATDTGDDALLGRADECRRLGALLADAVDGHGGALVLRGAAGVGKTALLQHCAARSSGMRVLHATGAPFEADLPFSALHQLARPLLHRLGDLPAQQADALRTVFAIDGSSRPVNRLAAYVATLSLLTTAAEDTPVLCLVDDAHWIDPASAEALLFTARRLLADRVAVVFAARDAPAFPAPGLPELPLTGLARDDAIRLAMRAGLDRRVAADLAAATAGNPLALTELPATLSEEHRNGWLPLREPLVLVERIETTVLAHARGLPDDTWRALVACAVTEVTTPALLERILVADGLRLGVLDPAVDAGLIRVTDREVTFRHPLTRAAVHSVAGPGRRRAAHLAVAAALTGDDTADRRAWHLAAATTVPDEGVAALLADSAERAQRRGGVVAEARAYERSARLTPDPDVRASRLAAASRAWANAGASRHAITLGEEAIGLTRRADLRCQVKPLLAHLAQQHGDTAGAEAYLADAQAYAQADPLGAARLMSARVNQFWARLDVTGMVPLCARVAELAAADAGATWPKGPIRLAAAQVLAGLPEGVASARALVAACAGHADGSAAELAEVFCWLGDHDTARALLEPEIDRARAADDVFLLAYALPRLAGLEWRTGRLHAAYQAAAEAVRIAEQVALPVLRAEALAALALVEALLGEEPEALTHVEDARRLLPGEFREIEVRLRYATGIAAAVGARWQDAVTELERVRRAQRDGGIAEPGWLPVAAELAEAYAHLSDPQRSARRLRDLAGAGGAAARAAAARVESLLAGEPDLDEVFAAALARCDPAVVPLERARTLLSYGQRLRRARRRRDARVQLHAALRLFEALGAQGWARRCRTEIDATGRRPPEPGDRTVDRLTGQERLIALHVAEGLTNREIAARVFLSPKTVEYHLGNVYRKLRLRSRPELIRHLSGPPAAG